MIELTDIYCPPNCVFLLDDDRFIWAGFDRFEASGIDHLLIYDMRMEAIKRRRSLDA
jgi:hypothetical protein